MYPRNSDGSVLRDYSTYARSLDMLHGAYHPFDLTPPGGREDAKSKTNRLRRNDSY
jgi:predicted dithiol-disulfide oxidoreductase (DUF899 family)